MSKKALIRPLNISGVSWRKNSHAVSPQMTNPALKMVLAASEGIVFCNFIDVKY